MIKVVHIYKDFDTYNGLIESFLFLARNYDERKISFNMCVFNYAGGIYGKKLEALGANLVNLNCGKGMLGYLRSFHRLYSFLKFNKPEVVVTHDRRGNFIGVPVSRIAGIPITISTETTLKNSATTVIRRLRDRLFHPLLSAIISLSDVFVANSEAVKRQWSQESNPSKFRVIYPPFNLEKYEHAMKEKLGEARAMPFPTLGYIGRISEEKGLHHLVEALVTIKNTYPMVKLLVAGAGAFEGDVKRMIREFGLEENVIFLGFQENSFKVMRRIDLLVVPSRTEGFGMAALEAMAMGVPVVASNVGGLKEIVTEDVGRLIPPQDVRALSRAILLLLDHPEEMLRMGVRGRKRVFQFFRPEKYTEQFEDLFESMLKVKQHMAYE